MMKLYEFKVAEKYVPNVMEGTIYAKTKDEAVKELKEWYACELGTNESEINVKSIEVVQQ